MRRSGVLVVLAAVSALGQPQTPPESSAPPPPPPPSAGARLDGPVGNQVQAPQVDASKVPDPEKIRQSAAALERMRTALKEVLGKLEEARTSKDVVKLNCVNEKLAQIKGLLRISEQSDVQLQESVARRETSAAEHEFTKVTIARSRVEQLRAEAEDCIGQLAFRTDENLSLEVDVPDYLPGSDPTQMPAPVPIDTRPVPASPTM